MNDATRHDTSRDLLQIGSVLGQWMSDELQEYRARICSFCGTALAGARESHSSREEVGGWSTDFAREFRRELGNQGFLGQSWPEPYGSGKGILYDVVLADELEYHAAPAGVLLDSSILHTPYLLMAHAQPQILDVMMPLFHAGEVSVALGYSEPEAGSDLASLTTRATPSDRRGNGEYRITGEKSYTSDAHCATHAVIAARIEDERWTDKHEGITLFWIPMDRDGITVHSDRTVTGALHARISLDGVVAMEHEVLGEPGSGWRILTEGLTHERAIIGNPGQPEAELHDFLSLCKTCVVSGADAADAMMIENEARALSYVLAAAAVAGVALPRDGSLAQVVKRESVRALQELRLGHAPPQAMDDALSASPPNGSAEWRWLRDLFYLFAAGGLDVSRTVIAKDVLASAKI